jgi:Zn-dependent protease with chaperone function
VSWLNGDSQATVLLFQVEEKKKLLLFPSPPFPPPFLLRFLSLLFRLDMAFQNPNASGVSVVFSLTLTVPFPLLLTVPLGMFSQFSFPSFLVCSLLSSLRFLPFSFLFSLFLPLSPLFACWRWEVFIGQKGAGASLLPPYGSAWGAGLAALPQRRVGWAVGVAGRARLPWCIIMRVCGVSGSGRHVACRVH